MSDLAVASEGPLPGYSDRPWRQVTAAANSLAAAGMVPLALCLQGVVPEEYEEPRLQADMKHFSAEAKANDMIFSDANIQVSPVTEIPQYFVTGIGRLCKEPVASPPLTEQPLTVETVGPKKAQGRHCLRPGQDLLVTRQIALTGTAALASVYEQELLKRYPFWLIDRAKGFERWMSVTGAARAVNHFGACSMHCVAQGGIFNALWEMAESADVGLEVDLKKIPVMQETIEICEYFDLNPYYLYSAGALLIGTEQSESLIAVLREADIPACVIGQVTDKNDRVIRNGENRRFLDRPKPDELWKIR
ncbi:MAG: hydrogenase maturation factor [Clostridiales bacterium]|nr:hydrogenase maturation factor [Clostridiales bacterium]